MSDTFLNLPIAILLMISDILMCCLLGISILMANQIMSLCDKTILFFVNSWRLRIKYVNFLDLDLFISPRAMPSFVCNRAGTLRTNMFDLISHMIVLTGLDLFMILCVHGFVLDLRWKFFYWSVQIGMMRRLNNLTKILFIECIWLQGFGTSIYKVVLLVMMDLILRDVLDEIVSGWLMNFRDTEFASNLLMRLRNNTNGIRFDRRGRSSVQIPFTYLHF